MRLFDIDRSAAIAWSVLQQQPSLIATGTVAGTLGIDFDTSAHLEIFSVDLSKKTTNCLGKASANDRFNKLVWGLTGTQSGAHPKGILAGGLANGNVTLWDPEKIISGKGDDALIANCERHSAGPVQGLDFNPYQHNLLASGGGDSEIFIWDLANPTTPTVYNPGAKTAQQNIQDNPITAVQWNRKVQHILGSTNHNGTTAVWDLKAKRAVLTFSDPSRKLRCRAMAWNPDEGTQLITASEDDATPIIAVWDLRNTYAPSRIFEGHTAGIWGLSWCPMDSDLLLSCGKDNKTLCWNVKTGDVLCDVDINAQRWNFDVQWSPRIPAILSTASLDGKVRVYSLQDVRSEQVQDNKSLGIGVQPAQPTKATPPKWLKRPAGVTFGFGGKIAYFKKPKTATDAKKVHLVQVVSDKELLARADKLEQSLEGDVSLLKAFCEEKIAAASTADEKAVWGMLKVLQEDSQRKEILKYLGYDSEKIEQELAKFTNKSAESPKEEEVSPKEEVEEDKEETTETEEKKDVSGLFAANTDETANLFEKLSVEEKTETEAIPSPRNPMQFVFEGTEGMISNALLIGNFELAVECCIKADRLADALVLAAYGGPALWAKTQAAYFKKNNQPFMRVVSSIVNSELRSVVEQAELSQWKSALAILCTYAKKEEFAILSGLLGDRLFQKKDTKSAVLCYICAGNIDKTVSLWNQIGEGESNLDELQSIIEKVSVFRRVIRHKEPLTPGLAKKFSAYALILASQGRLKNALRFLSFLSNMKYDETNPLPFILLDRIYQSARDKSSPSPQFPFQKQDVPVPGYQQQQPQNRPAQTNQPYPVKQPTQPPTQPHVHPTPKTFQPTPQPFQPTPPAPVTPPAPRPTPSPFPSVPVVGPTPTPYQPFTPTPHPSMPVPGPTPYPNIPVHPQPTPFPSMPAPTPTPVPNPLPPMPNPTPAPNPVPPTQFRPAPPVPGPAVQEPPKKVVAPPPPPTGNAPPPTGHAPPSEKPAIQKASPQENQFVIDSMNAILNTASKSTDQKISKFVPDIRKRFEPMFDKLSKNEFSGNVSQNLYQLCQAINSGDSKSAQNIHITLTQNNWEELGSSLMIGLKRLVEITKS